MALMPQHGWVVYAATASEAQALFVVPMAALQIAVAGS